MFIGWVVGRSEDAVDGEARYVILHVYFIRFLFGAFRSHVFSSKRKSVAQTNMTSSEQVWKRSCVRLRLPD